jgi:hypothetical protein
MGSWGLDPFDNDDAGDWSWTLEDGAGPEALRDAFAAVVPPSADASAGANAVAAASLVAAARGVRVTIPESMQEWLEAQDGPTVAALAPEAVAALDAVLSGSEVAATWDEQGAEWRERTRAMRAALAES